MKVNYNAQRKTMIELRKECREWAETIRQSYVPDLIIFIAKSGFIIADEFSKAYNLPKYEIEAHRSGSVIKKILAPFFSSIPIKVRNRIVASDFMYALNEKKAERNVRVSKALVELPQKSKFKNIMLIDDSVDTGWTFLSVIREIYNIFPDSEVKTVTLIEMTYSRKRFQVDYSLYRDTLLLTPAQMDSEEYFLFLKQYEDWRNGKV